MVVACKKVCPLKLARMFEEVEMKPSFPYILVSTKFAVDDAWRPAWNQIGVEVEFTATPKLVLPMVNGNGEAFAEVR